MDTPHTTPEVREPPEPAPPPGELGRTELLALLRADQQRRWHRGCPVAPHEYLKEFPRLATDDESLLDLLCNEVALREECGDSGAAAGLTLHPRVAFPGLGRPGN